MSFSNPPSNDISTKKISSLFRTNAWISSWNKVWQNYLQQHALLADDHFYYISLPLLKFKLATAIPKGCTSIVVRSIRSEYFELPLESHNWLSLAKYRWHQLIVPDVELDSPTFHYLLSEAKAQRYFVLERSVATAYGISTLDKSFAEYLSSLSQSARARLFNKRKKLEQLGAIKLHNIWPDTDRFIELLNAFHLERWQKPCYQDENLDFIKSFLHAIVEEGGDVNLSVMTLNDQPVSVLLDIEYGGRVHNLQAGFAEKIAPNIALGSLHLGYAIESAFTNSRVNYYDFMAGQGKNTDYKAAFCNHTQRLATLYLIKSSWLYWLYRLKDYIRP